MDRKLLQASLMVLMQEEEPPEVVAAVSCQVPLLKDLPEVAAVVLVLLTEQLGQAHPLQPVGIHEVPAVLVHAT